MQEKDGKYIFGVVKVGDKGQIVIPRDARRQYDIKPGDALLLLGDQNGMALVKTQIFEDLIGQVMEGMDIVDAISWVSVYEGRPRENVFIKKITVIDGAE